MSSSPPSIRLEAYVQSLAPNKNRSMDRLLERINQLDAAGEIASAEVYVVGEELCTETAMATDSGRQLCARILQFREWANRTNKRFGSFFQPQSVRSTLTNDEYEAIPFPTFTLAEFADDALRFVSPCTDDDGHYTPQERLDVLSTSDRSGAINRGSLTN